MKQLKSEWCLGVARVHPFIVGTRTLCTMWNARTHTQVDCLLRQFWTLICPALRFISYPILSSFSLSPYSIILIFFISPTLLSSGEYNFLPCSCVCIEYFSYTQATTSILSMFNARHVIIQHPIDHFSSSCWFFLSLLHKNNIGTHTQNIRLTNRSYLFVRVHLTKFICILHVCVHAFQEDHSRCLESDEKRIRSGKDELEMFVDKRDDDRSSCLGAR